MNGPDTRTRSDVPDLAADGINHYCCCRDESRGFCGLDLSEVPETDDDINCVVCVDLSDGETCPFSGCECPDD